MDTQKLLKEWAKNKETKEVISIFKKPQNGEAFDIEDVSDVKIKSKNLKVFEIKFSKKSEKYILKCSEITNYTFEQTKKVNCEKTGICIRNGIKSLSLVIYFKNIVQSFNFIEGSLAQVANDSKITF